ncbi:MAG: hypothetical protein FWD88_08130, partial [Treponema sp.]|nr:hypothetical protein [Treponema sp.]
SKAPGTPVQADVLRELHDIDPNTITPIEALGLLSKWKQRLAAKPGAAVAPTTANPQKPRSGPPADSTPSLFD